MGTVFVNAEKEQRAKSIVELLSRSPRNEDEIAKKAHWTAVVKDAGEKENVLEFVYAKLGGLVRTEEEHKVALKRAEEAKKKSKKRE